MFIGFVKSFDPNLNELFPNYINSLIGGVFGYGIIWSIIYFYKQIRKKEGMGLGDAKLFAVIPIGPSGPFAVTTVTPVTNLDIADLYSF